LNIEKIQANIIELNNSNDIYMTMNVVLMTSKKNLNGARFTPDFMSEIVANKEFYMGIPLVCEKYKLESGKFKSLGHALQSDGTFETEQVGSFVDFYTVTNDNDVVELYGVAKVFKRFPKVCNAIIELFNDKSLFFSVEVLVGEYQSLSNNERVVSANVENRLFGDCIVTTPAEKESTAKLLIAEALNLDIGGGNVKIKSLEEFYTNTVYHFENSELDLTQVKTKVYNKVCETYGEELDGLYVCDFGVNYMILNDYNSANFYRVDFVVGDADVTVSAMTLVTKNYTPVAQPIVDGLEAESEMVDDMPCNDSNEGVDGCEGDCCEDATCGSASCSACKTKVAGCGDGKMAKAELENNSNEPEVVQAEVTETEIAEPEVVVAEPIVIENNSIEIFELNNTITELNLKIVSLSESVILKDNEISELKTFKEELEKINLEKAESEKASTIIELKNKYSKLLNESILALPEISEAIENLNEVVLASKVVEVALESITSNAKDASKLITASRITDNIEISGSDVVSKYITMQK